MHFEVPKAKTFKEFGGEYLMIVVSILTALALEHGAQTLHHNHVAHQASERIEAELGANLADLKTVIEHNRVETARLRELGKVLREGVRAKVDDEALMKTFYGKSRGVMELAIHSPTFQREAWDVAVANQAISWMSAPTQARYAAAYASMRDVQAASNGGMVRFLDGAFLQDVSSNLQMGLSNPREVYRLINQISAAYDSVNGNLIILQRDLEKARAAAH